MQFAIFQFPMIHSITFRCSWEVCILPIACVTTIVGGGGGGKQSELQGLENLSGSCDCHGQCREHDHDYEHHHNKMIPMLIMTITMINE